MDASTLDPNDGYAPPAGDLERLVALLTRVHERSAGSPTPRPLA
jgi:hypothetical protein